MGICASYQYRTKSGKLISWPQQEAEATKIIYPDGSVQEFRQPIKANLILSQNPHTFLCNSDLMFVNSRPPQVPEDEQLQLDQIYFLMPLSQSQSTLSLQQLCSLATKASAALSHLDKVYNCSSRQRFDLQLSDQNIGGGFKIVGITKSQSHL